MLTIRIGGSVGRIFRYPQVTVCYQCTSLGHLQANCVNGEHCLKCNVKGHTIGNFSSGPLLEFRFFLSFNRW